MKRFWLFLFLILAPILVKAEGEVDILWYGSESYVPPFFQGLPLWSSEGRIRLVAISNLSGRAPSSLYYRWSKDGTVLGNQSGVGVNTLTLSDTVLSLPITVKVDLRDGEDGDILGTRTITVAPSPSRLIVVEDNPLYGLMFNRSISESFSLSGQETNFSAIPLFARVTFKTAPALTYTWTTNTGDTRTGNRVTFRAPEEASGEASVRLRAVNSRVLVQAKDKSFLIQFGNQEGF